MSDEAGLMAVVRPVYPERQDHPPEGWLDEFGERYLGAVTRGMRARRVLKTDLVQQVRSWQQPGETMRRIVTQLAAQLH